jgi:membrane-bound serine protease (ClpP class)
MNINQYQLFKIVRIFMFLIMIVSGIIASSVQADSREILVLNVKGTVNPVLTDYIKRGIEQAEKDEAIACIIRLDTPGGLDSSMRDIVQKILDSRVPVVVYVPAGARAASAGVFITMAAHIAAMAPETAIGAAHPVSIGTEGEQQTSTTMEEKVLNDAAAYIRSIATQRGRNADWAEKAVRESVSLTGTEAQDQNVIDLVAPTLDNLISQLVGRNVTLVNGAAVTLDTQGAVVKNLNMNFVEDFLYKIADPNIAYILLSLGSLGIMAEIFSPGLIFPGILGAICLLLAFFSLGMLGANWTGVLLILLGIGLFIAEVLTPGFGLLFGGGLVSFIIGSIILFKGGSPLLKVSPWLIALIVILVAGFVAFAVTRIVSSYRRQATTGKEELVGKTAVAKQTLNPEGLVLFKGELWSAVSETGRVEPGEEVTITKVEGLKLSVKKK